MIRFEEFVHAIQGAIMSAAEVQMKENTRLIQDYFEPTDHQDAEDINLDEMIAKLEQLTQQSKSTKESVLKNQKEFLQTLESLREKKAGTQTKTPSFRAKSVSVQFPEHTEDGITMRHVDVPLITLIPVSMIQLSEVRFKTELEILQEDNDLHISFPVSGIEKNSTTSHPATSTIEIIVKPAELTDGLRVMVNGLNKALRGQIPN
jgi:uncharacterized membrane protein YfhO